MSSSSSAAVVAFMSFFLVESITTSRLSVTPCGFYISAFQASPMWALYDYLLLVFLFLFLLELYNTERIEFDVISCRRAKHKSVSLRLSPSKLIHKLHFNFFQRQFIFYLFVAIVLCYWCCVLVHLWRAFSHQGEARNKGEAKPTLKSTVVGHLNSTHVNKRANSGRTHIHNRRYEMCLGQHISLSLYRWLTRLPLVKMIIK